MAVISCQAEFNNGFLNEARVNNAGQLNSFGVSSQANIRSLGLPTIAGDLNHCVVAWLSLLPFGGVNVQDYLSSHARFFGVNFRQDIDKIYIRKSDLPELTPTLNNTAQSLFAALLFRVLLYESNDLISFVNIYRWNAFFIEVNRVPNKLTGLVVEVNVPAKYKYIGVEVVNANTDLSPNEL